MLAVVGCVVVSCVWSVIGYVPLCGLWYVAVNCAVVCSCMLLLILLMMLTLLWCVMF